MKSNASFCIKSITVSLIVAFIVLNLFSMFYYNVPIHSDCEDGSTDYTWEHDKNYIQMNEGIGFGRTNNEGYMDMDDYHGEDVNVLILGSSHLQGFSVPQNRNMSSLLQEMLKVNVYNLAIAGHNFKVCISNLKDALEKYHPDTVVIETSKISFTDDEVEMMLKGTVPQIASENKGIIGILQKSPFLRLAYSQFQNFISSEPDNKKEKKYADNDSLNELLHMIGDICENCGCKAVIFYHPTLSLNYDGTLQINTDERTQIWSALCKDNNIIYLDMTKKYADEYQEGRILPYGFLNTGIASGHLNADGHRMFAEELYKILNGEY